MSKHPIDELFKQRLENHAFESPMQLWDKIDQQRDRRKFLMRRALPTRLMVLGGAIILLAFGGWFALDQMKEESTKTGAEVAVTEDSLDAFFKDINPVADKENTQQTAIIAEVNTENATTIAEKNDADIVVSKTATKPARMLKGSENSREVIIPVEDENVQREVEEGLLIAQNEITENIDINNSSDNSESAVQDAEQAVTNTVETFDFATAQKGTDVINPLPIKNKLLSKKVMGSAELPTGETDCPTFIGLPGGLYMDMNASIDLAQRTMTINDPEMEAYLLEREKSEIPYFAFSAGLHLTALSERGFALKSGVDYSQINESFNYDGGEVVIITIHPSGDTTWEVKNLRIQATNKYQMVDIPLLAGYEHNFSDFSLSIYGGAFLNVKFAKKGNIVSNETMQPVGVTTGEPEKFAELFRERLGVGWYTSFGFGYKLPHRAQIRIEPYFRFYPKSFSASEYVIDQRYFLTGIKVGLRKRL